MKLSAPSYRPSKRLLVMTSAFGALGLLLGLLRIFSWDDQSVASLTQFWLGCGAFAVLLTLFDLQRRATIDDLSFARELPSSFALNRQQKVTASIENHSAWDLHISLHDSVSERLETSVFPMQQAVAAGQIGRFEYSVMAKRRGLATFDAPYLLVDSPFKLWQSVVRPELIDTAKVYPDFSAIVNSSVLGIEQAMRLIGANLSQRKGEGLEFNQLREFRDGDTLKQIDWKATAKLGSPISREYREEKDQNIVFLLDCSRRMRAKENQLSYFDHALNALLVSSYIALDKGDAVGVLAFSGEPSWLPPIKGKSSINQLLNHLYALHTSTQSSDYVAAAEDVMRLHRKRSLLILLTNLRDEDDADLRAAVRILSKRHLVMVVALQESTLAEAEALPLKSQQDIYLYSGVKLYADARRKTLAKLRAMGVSVVDATHKNLHVELVHEYLRLKHNGKI